MEEGLSGRFYIKAAGGVRGSGGGGGGTKCGRWNPTTEQVKVLTDLFRAGLRTPSTDQIQKISSQLSFYGKIESKNVFYWFQNHKARERQKRRKVSVDEKDVNIRREEKIPQPKYFAEVTNHVVEPAADRVIQTLQLFPITSFDEPEPAEKLRLRVGECREFAHTFVSDIDHPPLDLRLSFF
ncbi:WUSCHEL-related homeobox 7-like [Punica granatum]|uniref:Homeobox domain-containing protein n=2 Tax=Punica granatum TaxID=22663 RepID=A0A218WBV6_PUNGR|nr:WUSCHEL-related homeobox 7-like [Punica granatum]OWM69979.1 hypothetical protein CDL15_Pgr025828 [Punica granatum]PKI39593.1 hypothetical protein CRG98_040063 [Punica granatum]